MTFSYTRSIGQLADKNIFDRGLRIYLEGSVLDYQSLVLDSWRVYTVQNPESHPSFFEVRIPLLHKLLRSNQWDQAAQALEQSASCTCPYFQEYGCCRHLVAVCASLEKEFVKPEDVKVVQASTNIFDLELHSSNEIDRWLHNFEQAVYFGRSFRDKQKWLAQMTSQIQIEPGLMKELAPKLQSWALTQISDFETEKKVLSLAGETIFFGGQTWWQTWMPIVIKADFWNSKKLHEQIFGWRSEPKIHQFYTEIQNYWRNHLTGDQRIEIFKDLTGRDKVTFNIKLELAIDLGHWSWVELELDKLDPLTLLNISQFLPDQAEPIELLIFNQIRQWLDLVEPEAYTQIIDVLTKWRVIYGGSDLWDSIAKEIQVRHKKKSNLIKMLKLITY